jgi:hypothetical protein
MEANYPFAGNLFFEQFQVQRTSGYTTYEQTSHSGFGAFSVAFGIRGRTL